MSEFEKIREKYEKLREEERVKLRDKLEFKDSELKTIKRGGKGLPDYGQTRLMKKYDLQNWKWVEVVDDKHFQALISLNMPDVDPGSGNMHALYDRIGIRFTWFIKAKVGIRADSEKKLLETSWIDTGIELPLTDENIEEIESLITRGYDILYFISDENIGEIKSRNIRDFISELDKLRESLEDEKKP